ncbi:SGNH/GDSL hydrolase family protein [Caulobacter sp. 602-2]|uniref:SGNH/GDSL hydrolase family protein n=1 Tax=Caulobacter sp. 602-2 TaxID=2710887 RepID=A0A6G4R3S4_9CAUL|nr:SGNH/GDSL hydrolase family protein [Caulobacter sp. 602-2]NGM52135.1 SGNH/GDSL hydrolase family protein [Caulobacter sp. 602-2]
MNRSILSAALLLALAPAPLLAAPKAPAAAVAPAPAWRSAWGNAPIAPQAVARPGEARAFTDVTVRQVMRLNAGGEAVRLRLSNELNERPLAVGAITLARAGADGKILGAPIAVTVGGKAEFTIPPGAPVLSDPVILPVKAMDYVSAAVFYVGTQAPAGHRVRLFVAPPGNHVAKDAIPGEEALKGPGLISGVEVRGQGEAPVLVAIGDSITEGSGSTPNADKGWPEQLAARLAARGQGWSVVNMGVGGGRLLREVSGPSALSRFDRDVLSVAGVKAVVVLEGINDIGRAVQPGFTADVVGPEDLIAGYRQLIARAHARGVKVYGGVIPPFEGAAYYHDKGEATRQAVNAWIRTGGEFDGVIDFDGAVRDAAKPGRIREGLHNGDHLHPNDAGYELMAQAADKALFPGK